METDVKVVNYTIIIPHKNIPTLLRRCIDSIPLRDDLEIIVVDDNSDCGIVDFDNFPGQERADTTVILDKKGGGAGHARNIALERARGKWLVFADADDFFMPCFGEILDEYVDCEADVVYFKACSVNSETLEPASRTAWQNSMVDDFLSGKKKGELRLRYKRQVAWSKLFKAEIVNRYGIKFDETYKNNDVTFVYLAAFHARKVAASNREMYCATFRDSSITYNRQSNRDDVRRGVIDVFARYELFLRNNKIRLSKTRQLPKLLGGYRLSDKSVYRELMRKLVAMGFNRPRLVMRVWLAIVRSRFSLRHLW